MNAGLEGTLGADLEALVHRYSLPQSTVRKLESLVEGVVSNPHLSTTVRDPVDVLRVHIADSLTGLEVEGLSRARTVVDIGTGAGFPGLALAAARPESRFDLIEAHGRKAEVARLLSKRAGVTNARLVRERAELWAIREGHEAYDASVCRAVGSLATVLELAAPMLCLEGLLVVWRGRRDLDVETAGDVAAEILGMRRLEVVPATPYPGSRNRHLYLFQKVRRVPDRFPRRPGMARKRPLA